MAAIYLFLRGGKRSMAAGGALLGIAALFHPETAAVFGILSVFLAVKNKKVFFALILAVAIASAYYLPFLATHGLPEVNALHEEYRTRNASLETPQLQDFFFEITPDSYFTFAIAALAAIGAWRAKNRFFQYWLLLALVLTIAAERFMIYLIVPVAFLAVYAIAYLETKMKASGKLFFMIMALILIYCAIFAAAKIIYFSQAYPTLEQYDAMLWIRENTPKNSTILTDWAWGHWISGIANRKNFVDGFAEYAPQANARIAELEEFYRTCKIPQGYNISYIYMEKWFADSENMSCIYKFEMVYNQTQLYVFIVNPVKNPDINTGLTYSSQGNLI
jgi:asparagine N-glycosylation enzyme membrane subunit Stt3